MFLGMLWPNLYRKVQIVELALNVIPTFRKRSNTVSPIQFIFKCHFNMPSINLETPVQSGWFKLVTMFSTNSIFGFSIPDRNPCPHIC
jgi:nitrate reductase gamma subunit